MEIPGITRLLAKASMVSEAAVPSPPPKFWYHPKGDRIIPVTSIHSQIVQSHDVEMGLDHDVVEDIIGDEHPVDVSEELENLAFEKGWVRGGFDRGLYLNATIISSLKKGVEFFSSMWPGAAEIMTVQLNDRWQGPLDPIEQYRFVKRGVLPESVMENAVQAPNKFRVSIDLQLGGDRPEKIFEALSSGKLPNVHRLSTGRDLSSQIQESAVLIMDAKAVIDLNPMLTAINGEWINEAPVFTVPVGSKLTIVTDRGLLESFQEQRNSKDGFVQTNAHKLVETATLVDLLDHHPSIYKRYDFNLIDIAEAAFKTRR